MAPTPGGRCLSRCPRPPVSIGLSIQIYFHIYQSIHYLNLLLIYLYGTCLYMYIHIYKYRRLVDAAYRGAPPLYRSIDRLRSTSVSIDLSKSTYNISIPIFMFIYINVDAWWTLPIEVNPPGIYRSID